MEQDVSDLGVRSFVTALRRPQTYVGQVREALSVAQCLARYPLGVAEAALTTGQPRGDAVHDTPVVLVHGFGHNRSGWYLLERRLRRAGFSSVHTMNYSAWSSDIPDLARRLAERIEAICAMTGASRVHVVGHSLGGIVLRWYVQELGGEHRVDTAVTVASPHRGTNAAWLARGPVAPHLRPGSPILRRLAASARSTPVRWVAYYSNLDLLVPGAAAKLLTPALSAENILMKDHGHLSIMMSPKLANSIVEHLEGAEAGRMAA